MNASTANLRLLPVIGMLCPVALPGADSKATYHPAQSLVTASADAMPKRQRKPGRSVTGAMSVFHIDLRVVDANSDEIDS